MHKQILLATLLALLSGAQAQAQTTADYGDIFGFVTSNNNVPLSTPLDSFLTRKLSVKKVSGGMDFRQEYYRAINEKGMRGISYIFDLDGEKPLYELIFEFENADTLLALMTASLGPSDHPTLADHWLINKSASGVVSLLWLFDTKIVIASNLPGTEFETETSFDVPDEFFVQNATDDSVVAPGDGSYQTLALNSYLKSAADNDLEEMRADPVAGKKDEYVATIAYPGAEQTIVRKNAAGKWRLEARRIFDTIDDARSYYDETLNQLTNLEGLEYRLVRKTEFSTNTGNTYVWMVQTLDDQALGILLKLQLFAAGNNRYGVRIETGKE
jgi:hypothetical protein